MLDSAEETELDSAEEPELDSSLERSELDSELDDDEHSQSYTTSSLTTHALSVHSYSVQNSLQSSTAPHALQLFSPQSDAVSHSGSMQTQLSGGATVQISSGVQQSV